MKHIGFDVHSKMTAACVRNSMGRVVLRGEFPTIRAELEKFIAGIKGRKRAAVEESQMADWVTRILAPHLEEVIRCQPSHNRLISESEDKCDLRDAETLSDLLYMNRLKKVHHPAREYATLRESVRAYWIMSRETTRAKNRLKALFLFNGSHEPGRAIYAKRNRERVLERVRGQGWNVALVELFFQHMDHCREMKASHIRVLRQLTVPFRAEVNHLETIPGIGPISAYTLVAYLENGQRIKNKRQLWKYAGLSIRRHESGGSGTQGASRTGNRILKRVLMSAAMTVVSRQGQNALTALWDRWIREGVDPERARRNLARKIGVIVQCVLRSGKEYRDERVTT